MQELLTYLVTSILNHDNVAIEKQESEYDLHFKIAVPSENVGIVIGKRGCVINSLRKILSLKLPQNINKRIFLKVEANE